MHHPEPKPFVQTLAGYIVGDAYVPCEKLIRLSFNEGAFGPSPQAVAAYQDAASCLHRYPDLHYSALRSAIADAYNVEAARVVCGAGSDDLINLLARAYAGPGDEIIYSQYGFSMYPIVTKAAGAAGVTVAEKNLTLDVDGVLAAVTPRTRIVFVANPNNPTGSYVSADAIRRLHAGLPRTVLLVLDSAYAEYMTAPDYDDGLELAATMPNVVVTHTFSKIHALAGLRIGWSYGPAAIADTLNRVRNPFNITAPSAAAAIASLGDKDFLRRSHEHNTACRDGFAAKLKERGVCAVHPGAANFLLLGFGSAERAKALHQYLKDEVIHLRPMGGYGLGDCLRVTIGRDAEMQALLDAMTKFCAKE